MIKEYRVFRLAKKACFEIVEQKRAGQTFSCKFQRQ